MMSFTKGSVNKGLRWILLFALAVMVVGLLQLPHLRPVFASYPDSYPWSAAPVLDVSKYDWGYGQCPPNDTGCYTLPYPEGSSHPTAGMADPWGYGLRNCTSYVAWKINQVFG